MRNVKKQLADMYDPRIVHENVQCAKCLNTCFKREFPVIQL